MLALFLGFGVSSFIIILPTYHNDWRNLIRIFSDDDDAIDVIQPESIFEVFENITHNNEQDINIIIIILRSQNRLANMS